MSDRPDIAIVGPGVVGTALGLAAARAGYRVAAVGGRNAERSRAAAARIGPNVASGDPPAAAACADLVLLTVIDEAIEPVGRALAEAGAFRTGAVVAHCSGALPGEVLAPARGRCGAAVGSMHPLQTFPDADSAVERLAGTHFFIEGDAAARAALEALATGVGGVPVRIAPGAKLLYHAAAVLACNGLTTLLDASLAAAGHAGIEAASALAAVEGLVRATVDNGFRLGPAAALTGPVARGDAALVAREAAALHAADPALGRLYRALAAWTCELALRKGSIDARQAGAVRRALEAE